MNQQESKATSGFDRPGTLERPRPIGRLVRLGLGAACLYLVWVLLVHGGIWQLGNLVMWVWFVFGIWVLPPVVNIGFGKAWGVWWPRAGAMLVTLGAVVAGYLIEGTVLADPLWWVMKGLMIYVYGHMGLSFLLSAILATPGCEMRAIPQLIGIIMRRPSAEHYCPGFIDTVDRWESKLKKS